MLVILLLISGCGSDAEKIKVGTIKYMNVTEEAFNAFEAAQGNCEFVFFDNMPSMLAALQGGQIDEMSTYQTVADYLVIENHNIEQTTGDSVMIDIFCCAMREDDAALKAEFDNAIRQMRQDGTFTNLLKTYMSDIHHSIIPDPIAMPTFYGAQTIKIGVTGDLPRMDYIRADGVPAGFNTAVLAEISRIIGKNFVLVQIDSGARAVALLSGMVDVIFWAAISDNNTSVPDDFDRPAGMIFTEPYFSDKIVHVNLKK